MFPTKLKEGRLKVKLRCQHVLEWNSCFCGMLIDWSNIVAGPHLSLCHLSCFCTLTKFKVNKYWWKNSLLSKVSGDLTIPLIRLRDFRAIFIQPFFPRQIQGNRDSRPGRVQLRVRPEPQVQPLDLRRQVEGQLLPQVEARREGRVRGRRLGHFRSPLR